MYATVLHGPKDVRFASVADPNILKPTDAIIKLAATCICRSDLWPYRGLQPGKVFDMDIPLAEVAKGYRAMDERRAIKVMFRVDA